MIEGGSGGQDGGASVDSRPRAALWGVIRQQYLERNVCVCVCVCVNIFCETITIYCFCGPWVLKIMLSAALMDQSKSNRQ